MRVEQPPVDEAAVEAFVEQVAGDIAGAMTTIFCAIGDRLGLFSALAEGDGTAAQIAARAHVDERYVREWANGLVTAGYLTLDAASGRYALPPAHAPVLADEGGPAFFGGLHGMVREMLGVVDQVEDAFRTGGGVPLSGYGEDFWTATERTTRPSFEHQLLAEWIPAVEGLAEQLRGGARVADVGTGTGVAPIKIAQAYPEVRVHGIDIHEPNIEQARRAAAAAGLQDRVTFDAGDAVAKIPGTYDVMTIFLVLHDSADPLALLRNARAALADDGTLLIQEINCHADVHEDAGPIGTIVYGLSLLHCMTQSLAAGGAGLGTAGLPESSLRALCLEAGFGSVERVWEGPLDVIYAVRP